MWVLRLKFRFLYLQGFARWAILQPNSVGLKERSFYWKRLPSDWKGVGVVGGDQGEREERGAGLKIVSTKL